MYYIKWMFARLSTSALLGRHFLSLSELCGLCLVRNSCLCECCSWVAGCVAASVTCDLAFQSEQFWHPDPVCSVWDTAAAVRPQARDSTYTTHTLSLTIMLSEKQYIRNRGMTNKWTIQIVEIFLLLKGE